MKPTRPLTTWNELPRQVVRTLTGGQACVVATVDAQGCPDTTLMTWVVARNERLLALCVDTRSRAYQNLIERADVALEVLADEITLGVRGVASVEKEQMTAAPFPCAIVRVEVGEVRDHAAPGTRFVGPTYSYDDDKQHRLEFERTIFDELRTG